MAKARGSIVVDVFASPSKEAAERALKVVSWYLNDHPKLTVRRTVKQLSDRNEIKLEFVPKEVNEYDE